MPQTITIEINNETLESIDRYLSSQRVTVINDAGVAESRRTFASAEAFVEHQVGLLLKSVVDQFPPAALAEKLKQIRDLTAEVALVSRPQVRKVDAK
jgi:hypothetical protein